LLPEIVIPTKATTSPFDISYAGNQKKLFNIWADIKKMPIIK